MKDPKDIPIDNEMRDHVLGPLSSHPFWIRWRSKFFFPLTLLIVAFLIWKFLPVLLVHHFMEFFFGLVPKGLFNLLVEAPEALPEGIRHCGEILTARKSDQPWINPQYKVWIGVALVSGFISAMALCNRFAFLQSGLSPDATNKRKLADDLASGEGLASATAKTVGREASARFAEYFFSVRDDLTVPLMIAVAFVLCVVVLPAAAYQLHWLSHFWELVLDLGLLAGLVILVMLSRVPPEPDPRKRRWWLLLLAIVLWALPVFDSVANFLVHGAGAAFFSKPVPVKPVSLMPHLDTTLLVLGAIAFLAWFFWRKGLKEDLPQPEMTSEEQQNLVAQVLTELKTPNRVTRPLAPIELGEVSDKPVDPSFWPLFTGGIVPTSDQLSCLEKFRAGWLELMTRVQESPDTSDWWNGFNLLLMGVPGSGKTTTLIAAALYAATAGGVRPLIIVPRADKKRWLIARIGDILSASLLDTNFRCGELDSRTVRMFVEQGEALPSLLVATPADLESALFGMTRDGSDEERRVRTARYEHLMESLSAVMIENVADFDPVGRSHLAFQVEKLRLHQASKGIAMVSVTATPKLDEQGAVAMGSRLFGETGFRPERDTASLRLPPIDKQCQSVELISPKPAELAEEIAAGLLRRDLAAIFLRKGIDEEACAEQQKKISAAAGAGHLVVLGDLDQRVGHDGDIDSIVYQNLTTLDATVAVGLRFQGNATVLFHVRPESRPLLIEPKENALPTLASPAAPALSIPHTVSLWSTLRNGAVLESEMLKRILPAFSRQKTRQFKGKQLVELRVEPDLSGTNDLVILNRAAASIQPIDGSSIPRTTLQLQVTSAGGNISLGMLVRGDKDLTTSTDYRWVSVTGQIMASKSVEHSPVLMLRSEDGTFAAGSMHGMEDGQIAISARHYGGRGEDTVLPILELNWQAASPALRMKGGGSDYGASWYELADGDHLEEVIVSGEVAGLVSESGLESRQSGIPFEFPALISAVVIHGDPQAEESIAPDGLWSTSSDLKGRIHNGAATRRITEFLSQNLGGAANFCWPVCFSVLGKTVVWLVEPSGTGQSVSRTLFELLMGRAFRNDFIKSITDESSSSVLLAPAPRIGHPRRRPDSSTEKAVSTDPENSADSTNSEVDGESLQSVSEMQPQVEPEQHDASPLTEKTDDQTSQETSESLKSPQENTQTKNNEDQG
jgi:hypothetical protein